MREVGACATGARYHPGRSRPDEEPVLPTTLDTAQPEALALLAAKAAATKKGGDIRILDVGDLLGITDYFVIVSAGNERLLRTVVEEVERILKQDGVAPRRREGTPQTGWIVLDYGEIVVHAFTDEQRAYYQLERLWGDAPSVRFDERAAAGA